MEFCENELVTTYKFRDQQPLLIDVGAHYGRITRMFAEKGWRVIAFEPERKCRAVFKHNLAGFKNVTCIPKAVSDVSSKKVPFYVSDEYYGIHALKPFDKTHRLAYEVETITLTDALKELNIKKVTFLKIDIEGADFLALKGLDLKKWRPEVIMMEFMDSRSQPHFGYTHHDTAAYMKEYNYTTFVSEWEPHKGYSREGVPRIPREWYQCAPYPLAYEPSWGNLIFVPNEDKDKFANTVAAYSAIFKKLKQAEVAERKQK